jgi:hypothetical protein
MVLIPVQSGKAACINSFGTTRKREQDRILRRPKKQDLINDNEVLWWYVLPSHSRKVDADFVGRTRVCQVSDKSLTVSPFIDIELSMSCPPEIGWAVAGHANWPSGGLAAESSESAQPFDRQKGEDNAKLSTDTRRINFLTSARKELKVGISSALQATGIGKDDEGADFIASNTCLSPMPQTVTGLLAQLQVLCTMGLRVAKASSRVHAKLRRPQHTDPLTSGVTCAAAARERLHRSTPRVPHPPAGTPATAGEAASHRERALSTHSASKSTQTIQWPSWQLSTASSLRG